MLSRLLRLFITVYRYGISPVLGPRCRFQPSCSAYADEALRTHTLPRALALTGYRLARCHPWHPGGYDPVPPAIPVPPATPLPPANNVPGKPHSCGPATDFSRASCSVHR